jgi:hypothetical protein
MGWCCPKASYGGETQEVATQYGGAAFRVLPVVVGVLQEGRRARSASVVLAGQGALWGYAAHPSPNLMALVNGSLSGYDGAEGRDVVDRDA